MTVERARAIVDATLNSLLADCHVHHIYTGAGNATAGQRRLGGTRKGSRRDNLRREFAVSRFGNLSVARAVREDITTLDELRALARDGFVVIEANRMREIASFHLRRR